MRQGFASLRFVAGTYRIDGATYFVSVAPRGFPTFLAKSGGGLVESFVALLAEKAVPAKAGWTVRVRKRKGLTPSRSVFRRHFRDQSEATLYWHQICRDLRDGRFDDIRS